MKKYEQLIKRAFAMVLLVCLASTVATAQQTWKADPNHSKITFMITHSGISDILGLFQQFDATISAAQPNFSDAAFTLTINAASINTEVKKRDDHLRSADFFDVEKFPELTFSSTGIESAGENRYKLSGNLTIHGVTKPVTMDLWYRGTNENPNNNSQTAGFQLTGVIKRSDFGVGPKFPAPMLSDEVRIQADGEFIRQ
ncbi:YceI family protein [Parapedobacter lycopersici]|uniref:YceI family protein n=1 Tax=Parapedobacter lycopersici TaxID=1864939 RepID=UPI0033419309